MQSHGIWKAQKSKNPDLEVLEFNNMVVVFNAY